MADSVRIEELRRRVELDPASIAFAALAEEYRRGGQFEHAIAICEAGLQRHPAYLSARVTLGRALLETGRYDEARAQLEQVLRSAPENLAAIRGLAEIHHRVGDVRRALMIAAAYANSQPEPEPFRAGSHPQASAAPPPLQYTNCRQHCASDDPAPCSGAVARRVSPARAPVPLVGRVAHPYESTGTPRFPCGESWPPFVGAASTT